MRNVLRVLAFACLALVSAAQAQTVPSGHLTVSGSYLSDATGTVVANANILFAPVNNAGVPISFRAGGSSGGQAIVRPVTAHVVNGVFSVILADTSLTSPANVCYAVTVYDNVSGKQILGSGYGCVQPAAGASWCSGTGASTVCNFDQYTPALGALATVQAGQSAYQLAVANGFSGSLSAWLASLVGPAGSNGAAGAAGAAGVASLPQLAGVRVHGPLGTANLFNPAAATVGTYIQVSGVPASAGSLSSLAYSDYIPCNSGGTMATSAALPALGGNLTVAYYDQSYSFVSGSTAAVSAGGTFTCPSTAAFLIVTINATALSTEMVVNGSTIPSTYQAFGFYPSNVDDAKIASAQLADIAYSSAKLDALLAPYNMLNPALVTANTILNVSAGVCNTTTAYSGFFTTPAIPVSPSTAYTLWAADTDTNPSFGLVWLDLSGNCTGTPVTFPFTAGQTVTSPAGAYFVRFTEANSALTALPNPAGISRGTTIPATPLPFLALQTPTEASASSLNGVAWGVWGDSISSIFGSQWQIVVTKRTGLAQTFQDARPGRAFSTAFECYGTTTPGAALGTFSSSYASGNCGYQASFANGTNALINGTNGNTLAQNLNASGIKILVLRLGTNDESVTLGTLGDATTAGTLYGNMRWVIENLLQAAPTVRLLMVGPELNGFYGSAVTTIAAVDSAEEAIANVYSIPYLSLYKTSGNSFVTNSVYTRDSAGGSPTSPACTFTTAGLSCTASTLGTHPSDWAFQHVDGPTIAEFIKRFY